MFIFVLRKERAFTCTFQFFSLMLKTRNCCLVVVFPFFFLVALFICLFICFTWTSQMFFVTPTSAACRVQGPGDSFRVVTIPTYSEICCSVPVHPSSVHFSRNVAVFQMPQGTWNLFLRGAVGSLCFTGTTWPCQLQLLLREEEAEPRLGRGRSFGPREMLDYYPGSSCIGISGKVLFQSKSQARSLLSTLEWALCCRAGHIFGHDQRPECLSIFQGLPSHSHRVSCPPGCWIQALS